MVSVGWEQGKTQRCSASSMGRNRGVVVSEIQKLHLRWHKKTGEDMPLDIAKLPLDRIRRAVELTEKGITVAVPKYSPQPAETVEESMMDWDRQDDKNGNAYGS